MIDKTKRTKADQNRIEKLSKKIEDNLKKRLEASKEVYDLTSDEFNAFDDINKIDIGIQNQISILSARRQEMWKLLAKKHKLDHENKVYVIDLKKKQLREI